MSYHHTIDMMCLMPDSEDPTTSPYIRWHGKTVDMHETPMLPFGTRVRAHIPLTLQTALSGRSFLTEFVGLAPGHRGGLRLYNLLLIVFYRTRAPLQSVQRCIFWFTGQIGTLRMTHGCRGRKSSNSKFCHVILLLTPSLPFRTLRRLA